MDICTSAQKHVCYYVYMQSFSKHSALSAGWEAFWARPLFLIGVVLVVTAVSVASDTVLRSLSVGSGLLFAFNVLAFVVNILLSMGVLLIVLRVHDGIEAHYADLVEPIPQFWKYVLATVVSTFLVVLGLLFFIVPGIVLQIAFSMALYSILDKNYGPIEALTYSYRITRGHRLNLFLFMIILALLNMCGLFAFGFGLLVTIPISLLSLVWVYRWLQNEEKTDVVTIGVGSWFTAIAVSLGAICFFVVYLFFSVLSLGLNGDVSSRDIERGSSFVQAQLALDVYHQTEGVYPATLYQLVPNYISEIPLDAEGADMFAYRALDAGADYELCTVFETETAGFVCEYGSTTAGNDFQPFDFGE